MQQSVANYTVQSNLERFQDRCRPSEASLRVPGDPLRPPPLMPANCATLSLAQYGVRSDTWRHILAVTAAGAIAAIAVSQLAGSVATARHAH